MKVDFVAEFVALARQVPAEALETELRARFGGQQVRIEPVPPRQPVQIDDIDARLRQRMPVRVIAADLGVSRATIYRMLNGARRKVSASRA